MSKRLWTMAVLPTLVVTAGAANHLAPRDPFIREAFVDYEAGELWVSGKNFCAEPTLTVGGTEFELIDVNVTDTGPDVIHAVMAEQVLNVPGSYVLVLDCGTNRSGRRKEGTFVVAVGVQGPRGRAGAPGPPGADGAVGNQGPIGLRGPAGTDGVSGWAIESDCREVAAAELFSLHLTCTVGRVLSGGFTKHTDATCAANSNIGDTVVNNNGPRFGGDGWVVTVRNNDAAPAYFKFSIICAQMN